MHNLAELRTAYALVRRTFEDLEVEAKKDFRIRGNPAEGVKMLPGESYSSSGGAFVGATRFFMRPKCIKLRSRYIVRPDGHHCVISPDYLDFMFGDYGDGHRYCSATIFFKLLETGRERVRLSEELAVLLEPVAFASLEKPIAECDDELVLRT